MSSVTHHFKGAAWLYFDVFSTILHLEACCLPRLPVKAEKHRANLKCINQPPVIPVYFCSPVSSMAHSRKSPPPPAGTISGSKQKGMLGQTAFLESQGEGEPRRPGALLITHQIPTTSIPWAEVKACSENKKREEEIWIMLAYNSAATDSHVCSPLYPSILQNQCMAGRGSMAKENEQVSLNRVP
eukprot:1161312-Pelagomonas_calceolata.AAC.10